MAERRPRAPYRDPDDPAQHAGRLDHPAPVRPSAPAFRGQRALVAGAWVVAGGLAVGSVLTGVGPLGGFGALGGLTGTPHVVTVAEPFTSVGVDANSEDVRISYADVSAARVTYHGPRPESVRVGVQNGRLGVARDAVGGLEFSFGSQRIDIELPRAQAGAALSATVKASSGSVSVDGRFASLDVQTNSGAIRADGVIDTVRAQAGSGRIDVAGTIGDATLEAGSGRVQLEADGVRAARASTGSGAIDLELRGSTAPQEVRAKAGSGSISIDVPDAAYAVDLRAGSGRSSVDVPQDAASGHRIAIESGSGAVDVE